MKLVSTFKIPLLILDKSSWVFIKKYIIVWEYYNQLKNDNIL